MTQVHELIGVAAIAEILSLSVASVEELLANGAIPSVFQSGDRLASRIAVMAWHSQRELQRGTIAELTQLAQRTEGIMPIRPPGVSGDLNAATDEVAGG